MEFLCSGPQELRIATEDHAQVGHNVGVRTTVWRVVGKLGLDQSGQIPKWLIWLRPKVQDTWKLRRSSQRERESWKSTKQTLELSDQYGVHSMGREERVEYRDVSRHTFGGGRVVKVSKCTDNRFRLRNQNDQRRFADRHVARISWRFNLGKTDRATYGDCSACLSD